MEYTKEQITVDRVRVMALSQKGVITSKQRTEIEEAAKTLNTMSMKEIKKCFNTMDCFKATLWLMAGNYLQLYKAKEVKQIAWGIQDDKGNYVSDIAFQNLGNRKWAYVSCTGLCEQARWYLKKNTAVEIMQDITKTASKLKLNKVFNIVKFDCTGAFTGKMLFEYVN